MTIVSDIAVRAPALEAARAGDDRMLASLLEPHRHTLWSLCERITNDTRDAMDALMHTFGSVRRGISTYEEWQPFGQWLCQRAAATARVVAWHRQRHPEPPRKAMFSMPEHRDAAELRIRASLNALPVVVREALALRDLCGLTYEQLAAYQAVGIHTVKARLERGGGIRPLQGAPALDRTRFDQCLFAVLVRHRLDVEGRSAQ